MAGTHAIWFPWPSNGKSRRKSGSLCLRFQSPLPSPGRNAMTNRARGGDNTVSMARLSLDLDRAFVEFHACEVWDPAFRPGFAPSQAQLFEIVCAARNGDMSASSEFADTMYWTLREAAFDCFQRKYGPRPIRYEEWDHAKLKQYLEMLGYEKLVVDGIDRSGKLMVPQTDQPWNEGLYVIGS